MEFNACLKEKVIGAGRVSEGKHVESMEGDQVGLDDWDEYIAIDVCVDMNGVGNVEKAQDELRTISNSPS